MGTMAQLMLILESQLTDFGAVSAAYSGVQLGSPNEQHETTALDQNRTINELATLARIIRQNNVIYLSKSNFMMFDRAKDVTPFRATLFTHT